MKLYDVRTTAKKYRDCADVVFHWFYCDKRPERRPYAELIENYDPGAEYSGFAEQAVEELFSEDEARQLEDYLKQYDGTTVIQEAELPLPNNTMATGAIPVGGLCDFLMLYKNPAYTLPFKVMGYFDLRDSYTTSEEERASLEARVNAKLSGRARIESGFLPEFAEMGKN